MRDMTLPEIKGISLLARDGEKLTLSVTPDAGAPQFLRLLFWLPHAHELSFFDQYFPSPTDPGAYVDIQHKSEWFQYRMGNHGWTSGWLYQSPELLAALLVLNLTPKPGCPEPLTTLRVQKAAWLAPGFAAE